MTFASSLFQPAVVQLGEARRYSVQEFYIDSKGIEDLTNKYKSVEEKRVFCREFHWANIFCVSVYLRPPLSYVPIAIAGGLDSYQVVLESNILISPVHC